MADNMTIGPALAIGGNKVEMTQKGKIKVTNSQGKIKTLSQDEFKKQLIKNADKIEAGQDFEFKKDNKNAKIAGAVLGTAAAAALIIYRKQAGEFLGKLWNKTKTAAKNIKNKLNGKNKAEKHTIFDGEGSAKLKNELIGKTSHEKANAFDARVAELKKNHKATQADYNKTLGLKNGAEDKVEVLQRKYLKADGTVMNEKEQKAADKLAKSIEEGRNAEFSSLKDIAEKENHGVNVDPKMKAKWEAAHPELNQTK